MTGQRCVVHGCSNISNLKKGISIHKSPLNKKNRSKWRKFVDTHRRDFSTHGRFVVCSAHFENSCFTRQLHIEGSARILLPGAVPTIWKPQNEVQVSERHHRQALKKILTMAHAKASETLDEAKGFASNSRVEQSQSSHSEIQNVPESIENEHEEILQPGDHDSEFDNLYEDPEPAPTCSVITNECLNCLSLQETVKKLKKERNNLRTRLRRGKCRLEDSRRKVYKFVYQTQKNTVGTQTTDETEPPEDEDEVNSEADDDRDIHISELSKILC